MSNQPTYTFCMKQFKPAIFAILALTVITIIWTTYKEIKSSAIDSYSSIIDSNAVVPAATAPPIRSSQAAPHPNWGACTNCHQLIVARNTKGNGKKISLFVPAATAPPIAANATQPHPSWGACTNCHKIINNNRRNAGAKKINAMLPIATVAPPLGIWLRPLTPATADKLGLENTDGVIITGVQSNSPASEASLMVGDVIKNIDNQKVESLQQALAAIGSKNLQDTIKLKILRNGLERNIHVKIQNQPNSVGTQLGVPVATARNLQTRMNANTWASPLQNTKPVKNTFHTLAIASQGRMLSSQVATDLSMAPYLIIYDNRSGNYQAIAKTPAPDRELTSIQTSHLVVDQGASAVIAGNISPTSVRTLGSLGVLCFGGVSGQVGQAVQMFQRGQLAATTLSAAPPNSQTIGVKVAQMNTF